MKATKVLIAVGSVGIASTAFGRGVPPPPGPNDVTFGLPTHTFAVQPFGLSAVQTDVAVVQANNAPIIGITIQFDYAENPADASYASDLNLQILSADFNALGAVAANGLTFGGSSYGNTSAWGVRDYTWDFNGSISSPPGHYSHTTLFAPGAVPKTGADWTFNWQQCYNAGNTYSNITVTLHKAVPAPGALALLGMAGLTGIRRRRR
jgi:MYXO-CTERM domain-containing protein